VLDVPGGKVVTEEQDVLECGAVVETVVDGGSESTTTTTTTDVDEDDQLAVMTCSMSSATSGFDDDSCASSVVGGDEMPSEETWNFSVSEETVACMEHAAKLTTSQQNLASAVPAITDEQV